MGKRFFQLAYGLMIGVLILSACNLPGVSATPAIPTESPTRAVTATIDLAGTETRQAELLPSETPTVTATETPIPTPSDTATPEPITAEVAHESNCRLGPAGNYDLVATYKIGQKLEVLGKDLGNGYLVVKNPDKPDEPSCYLLANNVTIIGDLAALPKFTPPPSPTAAPYFKVAFKKFDICKGFNFAIFTVQNVGSVPFRSFYIRVTDQKVGKTVEQVQNAFDLHVGCVLAQNIAPLDPGADGYVNSPPLTWKATGNKLQVVIQLCTEKDLKGTCVIQSVLVNP